MLFEEVPGLHAIKSNLVRSVATNKVAHALLFDGKVGGAALPLALGFLSYLYCSEKGPNDACGTCSNCTKISKLAHPDIHFIFPTVGGKKVSSDQLIKEWRELILQNPFASLSDWIEYLNEQGKKIKQGNIPVEESRKIIQNLSIKSYEGGYKTVVIWVSESMGTSAANALLKILEEPPQKTLFVLISYQYDANIRTILSRTQRIPVDELEHQDIEDYLVEKIKIDNSKAKSLALQCDGNIHSAIQLARSQVDDATEWFMAWMRMCYAFDLKKIIPYTDDFAKLNTDIQKNYLEYSQKQLRQIYLDTVGANSLIFSDEASLDFTNKFSRALKFENFEEIIDSLSTSHYLIERNGNPKIVFLDLSLSISRLIK
ncbi:MAG: ATP-binding protein [Leadbetterella sp.]